MKPNLFFFATAVTLAHAFILPQLSTSSLSLTPESSDTFRLAKNPEFSIVEDDEHEGSEDNLIHDDTYTENYELPPSGDTESSASQPKRFEYAALSPGTATSLQIQVGDLALARKAWKKRRRSGSPLLVPCSVLNMDRASMLRGNLVYLLHKFGTSQKDGVVLSVVNMKRRFKSHLKGRLVDHATALGYEGPQDLVEGLFQGKATQDYYGVRLIHSEEEDTMYLKSPLSKYRALQKASQATLLQVVAEEDELASDTMKHTGFLRCKLEGGTKQKPYKYPPLSAALRVSQKEDVDSGNIQEGSIHSAVFFGFDDQGDGGSPLLTLSLNPAARPIAKKSWTAANSGKIQPKYFPIRNPRLMLEDLQVGAGPYDARIVRLGKGHAVVDFGVGRKFSQQSTDSVETPEYVKVFGTLRFKDAIAPASNGVHDDDEVDEDDSSSAIFSSMEEMLNKVDELDDLEDDEEAEDITHMFSLNDDGSLSYSDQESGETAIVNAADADGEDDAEEEEEAERSFMQPHSKRLQQQRTILLRVGEHVPVHIMSVSKQSSQFGVTMDPSKVRGKKAKDIKKEGSVEKKLERLSQMLGGLEMAEQLRGREYDGTVKATSRTGDWLYVQPNTESCDGDVALRLPVGVATIAEELSEASSFAQGDMVRIQLDGIDESRGQLAMRVVKKLSP